jgi:hypothetical protein
MVGSVGEDAAQLVGSDAAQTVGSVGVDAAQMVGSDAAQMVGSEGEDAAKIALRLWLGHEMHELGIALQVSQALPHT